MALDPSRYQLLVIDIQERLAGAMPEAACASTVKAAGNLVFAARELGVPVTFTEQYPQGLGPTVAALGADAPFVKTAFAATDEAGFDARLHPDRAVIVCGMEAHICVAHTALGLRAAGHEVIAAGDACLSRREEDRQAGFQWMRSRGVEVLPSETILFGWLTRAGGPLFKEISRRIR